MSSAQQARTVASVDVSSKLLTALPTLADTTRAPTRVNLCDDAPVMSRSVMRS